MALEEKRRALKSSFLAQVILLVLRILLVTTIIICNMETAQQKGVMTIHGMEQLSMQEI